LIFCISFNGYKESKIIIHYKGGSTMKTKLTVIAILATLVSACTTGTYMTKAYDDDIYFSPANVPPVTAMDNDVQARGKSAQVGNNDTKNKRIVFSQTDRNSDGTSSVNNYIYQPDENNNQGYQNYNMDNQKLAESDTTMLYNDDDVKYVINNYYDDNDSNIDFEYRINRFHRPFFYSPFLYDDWMYGGYYSPWNYDYYGMGYGWGYDSWYGGFGYPYSYYGGYYSPFSFGFGGYWGGGYGGYYNGYYNGYYGSGGGYYNDHQVARRRATNLNLPSGDNSYNKSASGERSSIGRRANSTNTVQSGQSRSRSMDVAGENQDGIKNATIVNDRRINSSSVGRQVSSQTQSGNTRRVYEPSTTSRTYEQGRVARQNQNYTPSYNKPRIVNQSNYNNSSYTRPRTAAPGAYDQPTVKSANSNSQNQTYTEPRSSSNMRQTYRSSSSYSIGSSSSPNRSSSSYSRSSSYSSPTYSAPSRSSSSPSYGGSSPSGSSSSGSSSGGSSGGSSSGGGGGGSGHRR
jgi:hypothetical protein